MTISVASRDVPAGRPAPTALGGLPASFVPDVLRVSLEREILRRFEQPDSLEARLGGIPPDVDAIRRELLASSLRLSESMAPELYARAREAARVLGVVEPIEIYQADGPENAAVHLIASPVVLEAQGRLLALLDQGCALALFGHELGHFLLHGPRNKDAEMTMRLLGALRHGRVPDEVAAELRALSMAHELSADRLGLLACQDLDAFLRLEMICTTGLSAKTLTWDTQAYLAQSQELIAGMLGAGDVARGTTHPEHSVRAYAAWLFWETKEYCALTGLGPGTRSLREIDQVLGRILRESTEDGPVDIYAPIPREVHHCALAAAVLVATADGEMAERELEVIERAFDGLIPDWRAYLDREVAKRRLFETGIVVTALGEPSLRAVFTVLVHVMLADEVASIDEVQTILGIADLLQARDLFSALLAPTLKSIGADLDVRTVESAPLPQPVTAHDADAALAAFLKNAAVRGTRVTPRRLLRLAGHRAAEPAAVRTIHAHLERASLRSHPSLSFDDLDVAITLTPHKAAPQKTVAVPLSADRAALRRAIGKLRDELVSGDGRSPSVRLREAKSGRVVDLALLDGVSTGLAERVLAQIHAQKSVRLFEAAVESRLPQAKRLASSLIALTREHKSRWEETGADDLFVGYPLLAGAIDGYVVRGPLVLHPVKLALESRGTRAYSLVPKEEAPFVNQSLLRLIFHKRKHTLSDALLEKLDDICAEQGDTTETLLATLKEAGIECARPQGEIAPLSDDLMSLEHAKNIFRLDESLVLGLFPQSSSTLLQEYDTTLAGLDDPSKDVDALLGAASLLLPAKIRPPAAPKATSTQPLRPAIFADPSQRDVVLRARDATALVVDGPPGTGKSQVIANLITDAVSRGERVAVVCEKRAALDVVVQRLDQLGLRPLLGLVHDVHDDRRALLAQVAARLEQRSDIKLDSHELARVEAAADECAGSLRRRAHALSSRLSDGCPTLGELHAVSSSFDSPPPLNTPNLSHLDGVAVQSLAEALSELHSYADVLGSASEVRRISTSLGRVSFTALASSDLRELATRLATAAEAGERLEVLSRGQPSLSLLRSAEPGLEVAHRAANDLKSSAARMLLSRGAALLRSSPDLYVSVQAQTSRLAKVAGSALHVDVPLRIAISPIVEASLSVLTDWASRFLRFFSLAWWKARSQVIAIMPKLAPERVGSSLSVDLVQELSRRVQAAEAWKALDLVLDALGANDLAPMGPRELQVRVGELQGATATVGLLNEHRQSLQPLAAWPDSDFDGWQGSVSRHRERLAAHAAFSAALKPLLPTFTNLTETTSSAELQQARSIVVQYGQRLALADAALEEAAGTILGRADGHSKSEVLRLADSLSGLTGSAISHAILKTWAEQCIAALEARSPDARALDSQAEVERTDGLRLGSLEDERATHARACVWAACERAEILSADQPGKHQRRSAAQSTREEMLKEAKKQRKILPLRAFAQRFANRGMLDVIPVWLLSPETMVTLFPAEPLFDLVIFDEASQCTVANGFPVLSRTKRFVVAGDDKQMPPSSFFSSKVDTDDDDEEDEEAKFDKSMLEEESLLTLAAGRIERRSLSWHYRCRQESLIAFSNSAFYENNLQTIPSPHGPASAPAIRWVAVTGASYSEGVNLVEAERVVGVVEELLFRADKPTIGVVTFNLKQRSAILDCIDARRGTSETFAATWAAAEGHPDLDQRPFVKNLEQVQGDERDVIVFSLGHAQVQRKLKSGGTEPYVPARFGPLGQRGGERRLNVAISRAKQETHIVASFPPHLLNTARAKNRGPRLFKSYLEFAYHTANGAHAQARRTLDGLGERAVGNDSSKRTGLRGSLPLAAQIAAALEERGLRCERDVGASGFRVPVAVYSGDDTSRFKLALLSADGTDSADAFEVHVHRRRILEQRGWLVLRVTSPEWHRNPQRILDQLQALVAPSTPSPVSLGRTPRT